MTHQFAVGDIVRMNNMYEVLEVMGFWPKDETLLLCRWVRDGGRCFVPAESVTLVAPCRNVQSDHPRKIET